jgi:opacity protein-like surface antigen
MLPKPIRRTLFALFTGLILLGTAAPAHAQFGVSAGLNFESTGDIDGNSDATLENSTGYHLGVIYNLGLGPVDLRPGFFYRRTGQTYELPSSLDQANADVAAWEIPVDVRVNVLPLPLVKPYVLAGPKASFYRSDFGELDDDLSDVSYSIAVGVGADISLGSSLTLQPELRYDYGATDYIDESIEIGGTEFRQEDPRLSAFALRLSLLF